MPSPPRQPNDGSAKGAGETFLDRRSMGFAHWQWIAFIAVLAMAFIPRGARRSIESNTNRAEDWLPANYAESTDLRWFRQHFAGEAFALVSWEGCTLGKNERLKLLKQKLLALRDEQGWAWFPKVFTGPEAIDQLVEGPSALTRRSAIARLEGALVGPPKTDDSGESLGDLSRTTCLVAFFDDRLTANNRVMRSAVERIQQIAHAECDIPLPDLHMGGPPVDNVTIDIEGEKTLVRLAGLSGIVGLGLAYACFRSWQLTGMVFFAAVVSAGMSLALVFYYGVVEVFLLGIPQPRMGKTDAILMSMPAVVYVLGLSGAIHLVNYYRDERRNGGRRGAVENAVRVAWGPCLLAALTTAVGLGSLGSSDILPIQKFGVFTATGVVVAVGLLFSLLPVMLHCYPPKDEVIQPKRRDHSGGGHWYEPLARFTTRRHTLATVVCLMAMAFFAAGIPQIRTSVKLLKLLDPNCDLITDYAWLEENLGNLVPMEVIVALEPERLRLPGEPAAPEGGEHYRMSMYDRVGLVRALQEEVETLEPISRALTAATFGANPPKSGSASVRSGFEFAAAEKLEASRKSLADYVQPELDGQGRPTGRELWRVSARITALTDIDYGEFVDQLKAKVEPVLEAYAQRDELLGRLAEKGVALRDARVCLLTEGESKERRAPTPEERLAQLVRDSADKPRRFDLYDVDNYRRADSEQQADLCKRMARYDLIVSLDRSTADAIGSGNGEAVTVVSLAADKQADRLPAVEATAVYTGIVPLVYKTQRELLVSLRESIGWATVLIACVMVLVLRSPFAGLASMIPNVFPIVLVFGALGWLGIKVDIGIMMTASVALGVAVDDTLHFVTWFGRGIRQGLDRRSATRLAYDRCATAMTQTTLIAGLGLAVFAVSTFTPTQQFGCLMITMLGAALIGDLVLLPALLCGPLGWFFAPKAAATPPGGLEIDPRVGSGPRPGEPANETNPVREESEGEPELIPFPSDPPPPEPPPPHEGDLSPHSKSLRDKLQRFRRSSS